jgi:hypothetical protein
MKRLIAATFLVACLLQCPVAYAASDTDVLDQYRQITKQILLKLIELERFSLTYRRDSAREPQLKRLRYFLAQEAGAGTALAYECVLVDQLNEGRRHPLRIDKRALKNVSRTAMIGSVIAGSGSALEMTSLALLSARNHTKGFDSRGANAFMSTHLKEVRTLLSQHATYVAQHSDNPQFKQAQLEGKILGLMTDAIVYEYSRFHKDIRGYRTRENVFFALNIASNALGAASLHRGIEGLSRPQNNGPANVLFTVSSGITAVAPWIAQAAGAGMRKFAGHNLKNSIGRSSAFNYSELNAAQQEFGASLKEDHQTDVSAAIFRVGEYRGASENSSKTMESETRLMRYMNTVAVENSILAPAIGGTLLGQGIAGTVGFYKYHPRLKELDLTYKGGVAGTVGTSMAVGFTALGMIADWAYIRHLEKKHLLPRQIIEDRLQRLDEFEKKIATL